MYVSVYVWSLPMHVQVGLCSMDTKQMAGTYD